MGIEDVVYSVKVRDEFGPVVIIRDSAGIYEPREGEANIRNYSKKLLALFRSAETGEKIESRVRELEAKLDASANTGILSDITMLSIAYIIAKDAKKIVSEIPMIEVSGYEVAGRDLRVRRITENYSAASCYTGRFRTYFDELLKETADEMGLNGSVLMDFLHKLYPAKKIGRVERPSKRLSRGMSVKDQMMKEFKKSMSGEEEQHTTEKTVVISRSELEAMAGQETAHETETPKKIDISEVYDAAGKPGAIDAIRSEAQTPAISIPLHEKTDIIHRVEEQPELEKPSQHPDIIKEAEGLLPLGPEISPKPKEVCSEKDHAEEEALPKKKQEEPTREYRKPRAKGRHTRRSKDKEDEKPKKRGFFKKAALVTILLGIIGFGGASAVHAFVPKTRDYLNFQYLSYLGKAIEESSAFLREKIDYLKEKF